MERTQPKEEGFFEGLPDDIKRRYTMELSETLKEAGFTPELSQDGIFRPLVGVYKCVFSVCEETIGKFDGMKQLKVGFKINEVLTGAESKSQFNEFTSWIYSDGESAASKYKGIPFIVNALFTGGYEANLSGTNAEIIESIRGGLGTEVYIEGKSTPRKKKEGDEWVVDKSKDNKQTYSVLQEKVAMSKVKKVADSTPF